VFISIGRRLRVSPELRSVAAKRFNGQAEMIAALMRSQLKRAKRASCISLRPYRPVIFGYACGMTQHLCEKFNFSHYAPEMALVVVSDLAGGSVGPHEVVKMLIEVQTAQDEGYARAHRIGWDDLGTPSPTGLETLLQELRITSAHN
jgi:hypothetical protein